jgi:hypothetical protein
MINVVNNLNKYLFSIYYYFIHFFIYNVGVELSEDGAILTPKGLKICTYQIQELVLGALNQTIAGKLVKSVNVLRDSYTGKSYIGR